MQNRDISQTVLENEPHKFSIEESYQTKTYTRIWICTRATVTSFLCFFYVKHKSSEVDIHNSPYNQLHLIYNNIYKIG